MLGLELRKEFKGRRLKGTAIELTNNNKTGATQVPASDFLKITYPTADVLKTIEAVGPDQGRPVTLKGGRGQGKSHLMAMIYHAFTDNATTSQWLSEWSNRLSNDKIADLPLRSGMVVISESLHRQRYKFLWDLIFDQHPHGDYCRGKWESSGDKKTDIPSDEILLEMFKHTPTALILDEFQTWYDGLTNTKQYPWRNWAFNFIQILSEIAKEHPEEVRYVIGGSSDVPSRFRVIVLPQYWTSDPWEKNEESERPNNWDDRIPVLVLPKTPDKVESCLGEWLRDNLQANRNAVRFLLPRDGSENTFVDRDLIVLARAVYLAERWKAQNPEYSRLQSKYQKELRGILKTRFDRFAIISNWSFQEPKNCRFYIESHKAEGSKILDAIDKHINENIFIPEDFENFVLAAAPNNEPVGKLMRELREPRPGGQDCIPWLGETLVKERIIRLCARGKIAINLRGMEYLQRKDGESDDEAWRRMRGKLGTGKHLDETYVLLPQAVPATGGVVTPGGEQPPVTTKGGATGSAPGGEGGEQPQPPGIFGGTATFTPLSTPATSALNLLGKVESWGIGPGTQLQAMRLNVDNLTGAQLQDFLKKLPDGMTYELDVEKEDD